MLIFDQLLLTLIDHVLYKVSSSGTECANLSRLSVQGLDSSECLFYAQRGINLLKLNGRDFSPACVKAGEKSFQGFPANSVVSYTGQAVNLSFSACYLLHFSLRLLQMRKLFSCWELRRLKVKWNMLRLC